MIKRKCYEELGKRWVVKTESQEVFKKYTGIFAISSKGVIGYEVYKKGGKNPPFLCFNKRFIF